MTIQLEMALMNFEGSFFVGLGVMVGVSLVTINLIWEAARQERQRRERT